MAVKRLMPATVTDPLLDSRNPQLNVVVAQTGDIALRWGTSKRGNVIGQPVPVNCGLDPLLGSKLEVCGKCMGRCGAASLPRSFGRNLADAETRAVQVSNVCV